MTLKQILERNNIDSSQLDSLTHEAAGRMATRANNDGMSQQLSFLEQADMTEEDILQDLGLDEFVEALDE